MKYIILYGIISGYEQFHLLIPFTLKDFYNITSYLDDFFTNLSEDKISSFLNPENIIGFNYNTLLNLLRRINKEVNKSIWLWSGYTFEEIVNDPVKLKVLKEVDVLIDGRFMLDKRNIKLKYRGSENKRVIDVKESLLKGTAAIIEC